MLNFIKSDLNISKVFFEEFLKLSKQLLSKRKHELSFENKIKMEKIEEILNNKAGNRKVFNEIFRDTISEFNDMLKSLIKNKHILLKELIIPAFCIKMIAEIPKTFKY